MDQTEECEDAKNVGNSKSASCAPSVADILLSGSHDLSIKMNEMKTLFEAAAHSDLAGLQHDLKVISLRYEASTGADEAKNVQDEGALSYSDVVRGYRDGNGRNILHFACSGGKFENVKYLIGINRSMINDKDKSQEGAIFIASTLEDASICTYLLNDGASVAQSPSTGLSPLHSAVMHGSIACTRALLKAGAAVNATATALGTPLQYAVFRGDLDLANLLLDSGARPNLNDPSLKLPGLLTFCCDSSSVELVEALLKNGADPNLLTNDADPGSLHTVAETGNVEIASQLLKYGANPMLEVQGKSSLELAREKGNLQIAGLMEKAISERKGVTVTAAAAADMKDAGNRYYHARSFAAAAGKYSDALACLGYEAEDAKFRAILFSNRSNCQLNLGETDLAVEDAMRAIASDHSWSKGYYRLAKAYQGGRQWAMAKKTLETCLNFDENNHILRREFDVVCAVVDNLSVS